MQGVGSYSPPGVPRRFPSRGDLQWVLEVGVRPTGPAQGAQVDREAARGHAALSSACLHDSCIHQAAEAGSVAAPTLMLSQANASKTWASACSVRGWAQGLNWKLLCLYRGEVINGGFGLVLDGTPEAEQRARLMLSWDVSNGVSQPSPRHLLKAGPSVG